MALEQAATLAGYELAAAVALLEERLQLDPATLRCAQCQVELDASEDAALVVFDQHYGHNHGQDHPVVVGLTHPPCRESGAYGFDESLALRWLNPAEPLAVVDRGPEWPPMVAICQSYDVVVAAPDGSVYDVGRPWSSRPLAEHSIADDLLEGPIPTDPGVWVTVGPDSVSVFTDGAVWQALELGDRAEHQEWMAAAQAAPGIGVAFLPVLPAAAGAWWEASDGGEPPFSAVMALDVATQASALREAMAVRGALAFSAPVRLPGATDRGIGRNERCACGSGRKFKQCCDRRG